MAGGSPGILILHVMFPSVSLSAAARILHPVAAVALSWSTVVAISGPAPAGEPGARDPRAAHEPPIDRPVNEETNHREAGAVPPPGSNAADDVGAAVPGADRFAIVVHGGAGGVPADPAFRAARLEGLREALTIGRDLLAKGGASLDAVEAVVRFLEDHPDFNAGRGAVLNAAGDAECDASIMDGRTLACGGSAVTRRVRHPVSLARAVMEDGRHVLLGGEGADAFAEASGLEVVEPSWFVTEREARKLEEVRAREDGRASDPAGRRPDEKGETVGCVALDRRGHLAAATSTGGRRNKRVGRIGDSPVIGAGTYADDRTCAVSGTGIGEEFIRRAVAFDISARMAYRRSTLEAAVRDVLFETMEPGTGGLIGVDREGNVVMLFNTPGMARGAADSGGRFEVALGSDAEP